MLRNYGKLIRPTFNTLNGKTFASINPVNWIDDIIFNKVKFINQGWLDVVPFLFLYNALDLLKYVPLLPFVLSMKMTEANKPVLTVLGYISAVPFIAAIFVIGLAQVALRAATTALAAVLTFAAALTVLPVVALFVKTPAPASRPLFPTQTLVRPSEGVSSTRTMHNNGVVNLQESKSVQKREVLMTFPGTSSDSKNETQVPAYQPSDRSSSPGFGGATL